MRPKPLMPPATAIEGAAAEARRGAVFSTLPDVVNAEAPEARRAAAVNLAMIAIGLRGERVSGLGVRGLARALML